MGRPAVMFYLADVAPAVKQLPDEIAGQIFKAALSYAESDVEPNLEGLAAIAWSFLKPMLDRDFSRYDEKVLQRRYAVYCRDARRHGEEPPSFGEWAASIENGDATAENGDDHSTSNDNENDRPISGDASRYPTTTTTTTSAPTTTTTPKINKSTAKPAEPSVPEIFKRYAGEDEALLAALSEFGAVRKKMRKALTANTAERLLKKLDSFPAGDRIEILYQSCDHCWQDIYALKKGAENGKNNNNKWDLPPLPCVRRV